MNVIKKFITYYKPYKFIFFFDLFCATFIALIDLAFPQILRQMSHTIFNTQIETTKLIILGLIMFLGYLLQALAKYYVSCQGHIMGAYMERDMRKELFNHYQSLSFSFYDKNNTGQMMSRLVSDLFDISEMAHHGPENFLIALITIIGSFIILFNIQFVLALTLLIIVISMILVGIKQNNHMKATFSDNREKIGVINASLQDSLSGIRVSQSFTNEHAEINKFKQGNEAFLSSKKNNYRAMGSFQAKNTFFQGLMYLVTLILGGYLVINKQMTIEDLALFALYINIFVSPIKILVELTEMLQKGLSGFKRFLEIMTIKPEIVDDKDAKELIDPQGDIVLENVYFNYEDNQSVLSNISLKIPANKTTALVGPSGGGKTTICSLIPRFYDINKGMIKISNQDIKKIKLDSLRSNIGIVQQDVYLFGGTIKENIAYGNLEASDQEIIEAAKKANIHDFIVSLPQGYDSLVGQRGTRLSGGQKQRISIARVFLKNPPILILDEATSALDNESERHIQASLEKLAQNRTTIMIAHRLSTIKNSDQIIVIDDQQVKEIGNHQELINQDGIYSKYYKMQFEGL